MTIRRTLTIIVTAALLATALLGAWAFRTRREEDERGIRTYRWAWGRIREQAFDRDRDGRIDISVEYTSSSDTEFYSHSPPSRVRVDRNFDGRFDYSWTPHPVPVVHADQNYDGVFETVLRGEDARRFRESVTLFP